MRVTKPGKIVTLQGMTEFQNEYAHGITVVIPVRDRAAIVGRTLDSLAAQTYRPMRVLLVDNGSTDNTWEILSKWAETVRADDFEVEIISESRPGECSARNAGIRRVRTDWTMSFDSDDFMYPDHVARAMRVIDANRDAGLVIWGAADNWNGRDRILKVGKRHLWFQVICSGIMAPHRYCVRTELFCKAGMWDEDIAVHGDLDIAVRILAHKPKTIMATDGITYRIELSSDSMTRGKAESIVRRSLPAWRVIKSRVPVQCRRWIEFTQIYIWALLGKCDLKSAGVEKSDWASEGVLWRLWLKFVYHYTASGGRGACRVFMMFANKNKMP